MYRWTNHLHFSWPEAAAARALAFSSFFRLISLQRSWPLAEEEIGGVIGQVGFKYHGLTTVLKEQHIQLIYNTIIDLEQHFCLCIIHIYFWFGKLQIQCL